MSYEKVIITDIRSIQKKSNGQVFNFLHFTVLSSHSALLNDDAIKLLPLYESMKGQECLLPLELGEYQGKPSFNISGDGRPLPMAAPVVPVPQPITPHERQKTQLTPEPSAPEAQTEKTAEPAPAPLFNRRNGNNAAT